MPRVPREKSKSGIYHIIMRGINRQIIFNDDEDRHKFIYTLKKYKDICGYYIYAYCLMGNHVHLLLREGTESLGIVMRRICSKYVLWYNKKHDRVGYLFQDRFKSEPVEDSGYYLTVLRYIFQNPIKAGIVTRIEDYPWTNYSHYLEGNNWTDTDFALDIFDKDRTSAIRKFIDFVNRGNNDECLDLKEIRRLKDSEAIKLIKDVFKVEQLQDLQSLEKNQRNIYLKELKQKHGLSVRQIEKLTGINRGIIQRL